MTERKHALVDSAWLAANLGNPEVAIVEVDEDTTAYGAGHIPGAVSLDWQRELHDLPRRDFIGASGLARLLADKGIRADQRIVLYGGNNNWFAAYAYWLCRLRGIERVSLLDGGRKKWELEDRPMTTETLKREPGDLAVGEVDPSIRIFRDAVIAASHGNGVRFVDVRSPEEFSGAKMAPDHLPQEQPYVGGHIPGAANIPWSKATRDDGTFRPVEELADLYAGAGIDGSTPVVAYCRIGERSSHTWYVLSELLGFDDVRNYDGSWTEYGSLVDVPVEIGA